MGWLREHTDETLTEADPEKSSAVKTRHELFRLAHMDDGHENGQASVLFLFSPPIERLSMSVSTDQAAILYLRITCSVNGIFYASMYALDSFALASGAPKLALANSLINAFIMRMGLALLLSAPLGYEFIGIYTAQAAAPVLPAIIGFAYLRLWARRNSPVHQ